MEFIFEDRLCSLDLGLGAGYNPNPAPQTDSSPMPRRRNPDFMKDWKIPISATLAGRMEYVLTDNITKRPIYGARTRLLSALLERWLEEQKGTPHSELPHVPSLAELRMNGI